MKTALSETWNCYSKVTKVKMALTKRSGYMCVRICIILVICEGEHLLYSDVWDDALKCQWWLHQCYKYLWHKIHASNFIKLHDFTKCICTWNKMSYKVYVHNICNYIHLGCKIWRVLLSGNCLIVMILFTSLGAFWGCGEKRQLPNVEGVCEYIQ